MKYLPHRPIPIGDVLIGIIQFVAAAIIGAYLYAVTSPVILAYF